MSDHFHTNPVIFLLTGPGYCPFTTDISFQYPSGARDMLLISKLYCIIRQSSRICGTFVDPTLTVCPVVGQYWYGFVSIL